MIFGNKEKFAIECLKIMSSDGSLLIRSRIFVENEEIGDFEELAVSGTILLAIDSFLKFEGIRNIAQASREASFYYLHNSMYGDNWRLGMNENFRDKFSLHNLFELAISDHGDVIFLVAFPGQECILLGSRDGVYYRSVNVSEAAVNSTLKELATWMN